MNTTNKKFDCVAMKRTAALRIYRQLKDKTFEKKVDYWRRRSEIFHRNRELGASVVRQGRPR